MLFVNEGALGAGVLGHARYDASIRGLRDSGVGLVATSLPAMPWPARLAVRDVPGLGRLDLDLQTVRWHAVQGARLGRVLRAAERSVQPDVVCVNSHSSAVFATRAHAATPLVLLADASIWAWHRMGVWRPPMPWSRALLTPSLRRERRALETAAMTLASTAWAAEALAAAAPRASIQVLHPGLDLERFRPRPRAPRDPGAPARVLFVGGRFAPKGGDALLAALEPRLGRDVVLDVVTPAAIPPRPGVRVHRLAGDAPGLVELYREADLLCLPTRGDAAPWVVLEAMACGTPVVASDVGGISELLGDGGRLVAPGDDTALRRVLDELLADPGQRAALGEAGRARCECAYDARRQASQLAERLRAVAGAATHGW